jgi:hypothetical protein
MMVDEIFHTPPNGWPIRKLYAFLSVDEGGEGVCAQQLGATYFPMIVSSTKMLEKLKQDAKRLSRISGKRIVLAEFRRNGKELWSTEGEDA